MKKTLKLFLCGTIVLSMFTAFALPSSAAGTVLRKGSRGSAVRQLQLELNVASNTDLDCDGVYGSATKSAVTAFQRSAGVSADGIYGPKTDSAMEKKLSSLRSTAATGQVNASNLNLRTRASTKGDILKRLTRGTSIAVLSQRSGWYAVYAGGSYGFVSAQYVTTGSSSGAAALVKTAQSYIGNPYSIAKAGTYDAQGKLYMDCSYLVQKVFAQHGVSLPRTAAEQGRTCVDLGLTTTRSALKAGDLTFYSTARNGRYRNITHVGIYIGNGQMIDASSTKGKVVSRSIWGSPILYCASSKLLGL